MTDVPMKVIVDLSKPEGERVSEVPLTPEEIAANEALALEYAKEQAAIEAQAKALADLKASAKAKLIAGDPLTPEEADTLVV